jgi:hypothetical protein
MVLLQIRWGIEVKRRLFGIISLVAFVLIIISIPGAAFADRPANATPEVQIIVTSTTMNVQGISTESDAIAWSLDTPVRPKDYATIQMNDLFERSLGLFYDTQPVVQFNPSQSKFAAGGWNTNGVVGSTIVSPGVYSIAHQASLWPFPFSLFWKEYDNFAGISLQPGMSYTFTGGYTGPPPYPIGEGTLTSSPLDPEMSHYTSGYNEETVAVSGDLTYTKTMTTSTSNKIADQNNIDAQKSVQFVAINSGRMTSSEDMLLDGSSTWSNTANSILCPFANTTSQYIPAYCNIVQAGSSVDTTLTSLVTSSNARFISSDAGTPVNLNYNIDAQGLTTGNQNSPMIGSAAAFLKVHVQEARNTTTQKSEDLVYSETSSASGLISKFSKDMHYQSGFNLI